MLSTYIGVVDHKEGCLLATWLLVAASVWCFLWTAQWAIESEIKMLLVQPSRLVLNTDGDLSLLRALGWGQDICHYTPPMWAKQRVSQCLAWILLKERGASPHLRKRSWAFTC